MALVMSCSDGDGLIVMDVLGAGAYSPSRIFARFFAYSASDK